MGNFECNSMEDLVFSRSFRNWVFNRDSPESEFWENWIARNPDKRGMVDHAKAVIYALQLNPAMLSEEDIEAEVRKALHRLKDAPRYLSGDDPDAFGYPQADYPGIRGLFRSPRRAARILAFAAVFSGVCLTGYFLHRIIARQHRDTLKIFLASHRNAPVLQETGNTPANQTIELPDGSMVRLGLGSRLYYPNFLQNSDGRREVYLDGEAFFDIKKNASRPFYVYTGQVITKVLGTSFFIRSNPSDPTTTVTVRSGKVSVYREDDFYGNEPGAAVSGGDASGSAASAGDEPRGIVLTPNQEVVYDREEHRLNKTLSDKPERLVETPDTALVFSGPPPSRVFRRLQELYGIPIVYDEEAVSSCTLFATMGNESF